MEYLAIHGGKPVRTKPFPAYNVIGDEEKEAVQRVMDSGILSRFLGSWHSDFYGGPEVRAFEEEWANYFGVKHAIAVNSCTSGLYCAIGASGVGPGDEVIVSPYTMSASATSTIIFNAVPVFADIEPNHYCLDPASVESRITERTKAIVVVDIFGQPYDADAINAIAEKHGLLVIEDCAQAPHAKYKGKWAGTLGDIGVYSLNYHKHIHTGEGGVVVTDDDELAEKVRLIRNHAEAVVRNKGTLDLVNMVGFNFRMNEIEAAIGRCQLQKLEGLISKRITNADYLAKELSKFDGITAPAIREDSIHVYYIQCLKYDESVIGVPRDLFINAVKAELPITELREGEGVNMSVGYVKPLYLEPMYQNLIAYGDKGCPFKCPIYKGKTNYEKGLCPVAERLHEKELFSHEFIRPSMTKNDMDDVIDAFEKVYMNRSTI
ncbi:DegT/DnrJ/EryC1/StrS family aminotransferase [Methanolobus psychrotolerans]|uniref:DegT/DnrJ/EryC1/StrS family aminotransferase n=1 Tax=Methanolobus psychrotolerans TaxID=1874706 RepID=UPI000B915B69|nr:DegT/DnrJ/EryC1/StrS family aminotransferase [Methanolobus psychrotolerans]